MPWLYLTLPSSEKDNFKRTAILNWSSQFYLFCHSAQSNFFTPFNWLDSGGQCPRYFIRLNRETKSGLQLIFLESYNGKSFFLDYNWLLSVKLHLYTDAAGSLGYDAVFSLHWLYGQWPSNWLGHNITVLEMFPIVISLSIWASELANMDNLGLVDVINKKTAKNNKLIVLLHELVLQCLKHHLFQAVHVPGVLNVKADAYHAYRSWNASPWDRAWPTNKP